VTVDPILEARLAALELALGCPRRVPLLRCAACGYQVAWLRSKSRLRVDCPACDRRALERVRTVTWPPPMGRVETGM
jgi:DNA-directed RNA polymerase subunit RPC12/RpoP